MSEERDVLFIGTGAPVRVKPRNDWSTMSEVYIMLLAGPTGAGKSSFIEAMGNDKYLGISKDQLQGFTQTVTAYEVENVLARFGTNMRPVCLLDSPGFSDANISELEIIEQVKKWLHDQRFDIVDTIAYFYPITVNRLPGSRRKTIEMMKALITREKYNEGTLTIVTTMWDQVCNGRLRQRADDNFAYLSENVFKDMIAKGTCLTKFANTQKSALDILTSSLEHYHKAFWCALLDDDMDHDDLRQEAHGRHLYADLISRIETTWIKRNSVELDLAQTSATQDPELKFILADQLQETTRILHKFARQLYDIGPTPDGIPGLRDDVASYVKGKPWINEPPLEANVGRQLISGNDSEPVSKGRNGSQHLVMTQMDERHLAEEHTVSSATSSSSYQFAVGQFFTNLFSLK
ncbi:hypothetical protein CVT24_008488 [Panaeolus cyanescens]|uniref:Uncharacterized protein n=1 Tax=Panaeolus cyanescens TaxID=181874 RepID=A0A409YJH2_9AGAR|nr:hypothetical protein CVT24_008488 [Panaeolus cyanescens]